MTTFKGLIMPHHKRDNGSIPAKVRITHNRQVKYIATSIVFYPDQYTRSFKMKSCTPKFQLDELERTYTERLSKIKNLKDTTIENVIKMVTAETSSDSINFLEFWETELPDISDSSRKNYKTALARLREYTPILTTDDITVSFIEAYSKHLLKHGARAQSLYLGSFRYIFNQARKKYNDEEVGIIRIPRNPFSKFKVPKQRAAEKRNIPIEAVIQIARTPDGLFRRNLARDMFMFSFYTMGMNSIDIFGLESPKGGKVSYNRAKTKDRREDNAYMVVNLCDEAREIVEKYRGIERCFIFYKQYAGAPEFNTAINKGLKLITNHYRDIFDKQIEEGIIPEDSEFYLSNLEYYSARHTWATFAQNIVGIDKYTVHECLNHVDEKTRITDQYIGKDWNRINDANRKVLDKFREYLIK